MPLRKHCSSSAAHGVETAGEAAHVHTSSRSSKKLGKLLSFPPANSQQGEAMAMLRWAFIFLIISFVAGALGFSGISAGAGRISKILFIIFGVLFLLVVLVAYVIGEAF